MPLFVIGLNHRTAPVAVREKIAFDPDHLPQALAGFTGVEGVSEAVILSTCNRTEIYCWHRRADPSGMRRWLLDAKGVASQDLGAYTFDLTQADAVRHVFRVACGLDSMVLGEPQILGQLKSAYQTASQAGALGKLLNRLFQSAFFVAKQVRTDTAIGSSPVSVAFAGVRLAEQIFGDLRQQTALLIGAGDTINLTAQHLRERGLSDLIIANRSLERAQSIASRLGGYAIPLGNLAQHLAKADIVIAATASPRPLLTRTMVEQALKTRKHRPMFLLDIAVPRDIEADVGKLADAYLYTVDDLEAVIQENLHSRQLAAQQAEDIIATEVAHFMEWLQSLDAVSTIQALRDKTEAIRAKALQRAKRRLARGDPPAEVMALLANTLTNTLTHAPYVKLREASSAGREDLLKAAWELFDLGEVGGKD
jgi:glutamyl-tRNA reductase